MDRDLSVGEDIEGKEERPLETDEQWFLQSETYATISGGVAYIFSSMIKQSIETWITGTNLLILSSLALTIWLVAFSDVFRKVFGVSPKVDRGWNRTWNRVIVFIAATMAFVVMQAGTDIFYRFQEKSGETFLEVMVSTYVTLILFTATGFYVARIPGTRAGRRSM